MITLSDRQLAVLASAFSFARCARTSKYPARIAAGAFGFLTLIHALDRPEPQISVLEPFLEKMEVAGLQLRN